MPRWALVALTLIAFTLAMTAWGWVVGASVPSVHAWLVEYVGRGGIWAFFICLWIAAGIAVYRGGRKPKGT